MERELIFARMYSLEHSCKVVSGIISMYEHVFFISALYTSSGVALYLNRYVYRMLSLITPTHSLPSKLGYSVPMLHSVVFGSLSNRLTILLLTLVQEVIIAMAETVALIDIIFRIV